MGKRDGRNMLICFDPETGHEKWSSTLGVGTQAREYNTDFGDGPRSTPTIDGEFVYALSDLGLLGCFNKDEGNQVWTTNLVQDFGGKIPSWGYSESVLVDGERVIVTPGGENFLIGFDKKTGKQIWASKFSEGASYVSVIKHVFDGVPVYLTACKQGLVGIHCDTGELLFKNASTGNSIAVVPTPIVSGNIVYHSAGYKAGSAAVRITVVNGVLEAKEIYHEFKENMESHHGGTVLAEGTIFGFSRSLRGVWMAQDLEKGNVLWSKKIGGARSGAIAYADGLLYCYDDTDGVCYLVKPSRQGWIELGRVALPEQTTTDRKQGAIWAHPVIAKQKLFVRDQEHIFAFDIAAK